MLLGEWLVKLGAIQVELLQQYIHADDELRIGEQLIQAGLITPTQLRDALAAQRKLATLSNCIYPVDPELLAQQSLGRQADALALACDSQGHWHIAIVDPDQHAAVDALRRQFRLIQPPYLYLATEAELHALAAAVGSSAPDPTDQDTRLLCHALLEDAVNLGASDLHFEPQAQALQLRYRIDGVLQRRCLYQAALGHRLVEALKVQAGIDTARPKQAHDGRLSVQIGGRHVDFRAASMPTCHGDAFVLRVFDRERANPRLDALGLSTVWRQRLQPLPHLANGLVLIIGPTGSGKSTTLHALLAEVDQQARAVLTLEDPIEYLLPGARQSAVNRETKLDFSTALRALLRQDPDVILVGEIRDADTAKIAFDAASTGHLIFSTLHATSLHDAAPRLQALGISDHQLASVLRCVLGQRLLRRVCSHCQDNPGNCSHCRNIGYRGRVPIFECLIPSHHLTAQTWSQRYQQAQITTLEEDAQRCLSEAHTDNAEIIRVLGPHWSTVDG